MNIKEIRELIRLIEKSAISEFEMERSGVRIRVKKPLSPSKPIAVAPAAGEEREATPQREAIVEVSPQEPKEDLYTFTAPIVGTFYVTPKPDAEPFVHPGARVNSGTVLCVIEAMKIFNQIECDVSGEIVSMLVENGQPVEFGQPLFEIRLTS
jgi:acetyl-CoA carboxylase biotin carboxyl carrier protein